MPPACKTACERDVGPLTQGMGVSGILRPNGPDPLLEPSEGCRSGASARGGGGGGVRAGDVIGQPMFWGGLACGLWCTVLIC